MGRNVFGSSWRAKWTRGLVLITALALTASACGTTDGADVADAAHRSQSPTDGSVAESAKPVLDLSNGAEHGRWRREHRRRTTTTMADGGATTTASGGGSTTIAPGSGSTTTLADGGSTTTMDHSGHSTTTASGGGETPPAPPSGAAASRVITSADQGALANGFTVPAGEVWEFASDQDVHLQVSRNIIIEGVLRMRPSSATVEHFLQFTGVDETRFAGDGMSVLDNDIGLWVMGAGQLDLQGSRVTGWTRLAGSAGAGATSITLASAPTGWRVGDEISIAPTGTGRNSSMQFDVRQITAIEGATVSVDSGLEFAHPEVNGAWTAEVMNLTRNVRIEGSGANEPGPQTDGRAHVFIHSSQPQHIKYVQIRKMGPRRTTGNRNVPTDVVSGRYALHFHHNKDGSRGTIIEGVVVREWGSRAFVPHASHGMTLRDNVAFDGWGEAYWWDPPGTGVSDDRRDRRYDLSNDTHDLLYDHDIAALIRADPPNRGYRTDAFAMATGTNLTARNSVAVGVQGTVQASGFHWPQDNNLHPNNVWTFEDNIAHNNSTNGIFVWQNDGNAHIIDRFVGYNNGKNGIEQGAYLNRYEYRDIQLYGNGESALIQHNAPGGRETNRADGYTLAFENVQTDGPLILKKQSLTSNRPALYLNCSFTGVVVDNAGSAGTAFYDFVNCNLDPDDFTMRRVQPGGTIRVQDGGSAFQINDKGAVSSISPFYTG